MHLAWGWEQAQVVTVGEDPPMPSGDAVHGACQPCGDRLHAASDGVAIVGFHDQMRVIALQGVVHEPEVASVATGGERALDLVDDRHGAQRGYVVAHVERHVRR